MISEVVNEVEVYSNEVVVTSTTFDNKIIGSVRKNLTDESHIRRRDNYEY